MQQVRCSEIDHTTVVQRTFRELIWDGTSQGTTSLVTQIDRYSDLTATNLVGIPASATVTIDVGGAAYQTATLTNGYALITLTTLAGTGTYNLQARVTDLAGNQGTSATKTMDVQAATAWSLTANALISAPDQTMAREYAGAVYLSHALDLDLSPGSHQAGNPALVYDGRMVNVRPVIQGTVIASNAAALPATLNVELIWDGISQGTNSLSTTGLAKGDAITVAARPTATVSTGRHTWELRVTPAGGTTLVASGTTFVVNLADSPFGAGWNLSVLNRLIDIPAGIGQPAGKLWLYGSGGWRFFEGTASFTSPADDNGTLVRNLDLTYTYTTPEQTKFHFNTLGRQTSWVSADGKETISFSYDTLSGRLTGLTAVDGSSSTFAYDGNNKIDSISAPGSRTFNTTVNGSGDLASIVNPDGGTHAFTYNSAHQMTVETFANLENRWHYDSNGFMDEFTWGTSSSPSVFAIAPAAKQGLAALKKGLAVGTVTAPSPLSYVTSYRFDSSGRLKAQVQPNGATTTWDRDSAGRVNKITDPLGRETTYTRDSAGYVTGEDPPGPGSRTWTFHATYHGITSFTDENGKSHTWAYDAANGHLLKHTDALGNETDYAYDSSTGLLDTITLPKAAATDTVRRITTVTWDASRRRDTEVTKFGTTVLVSADYGYSSQGHLSTTQDAGGLVITTVHDALGRLTSKQVGNLAAATWVYNGAGLLTEAANENGNKTIPTYDNKGRGMVESTSAGGGLTGSLASFDAAGRTVATRDGMGAWTTFDLDNVGRAEKVTDAKGHYTVNVYNLADELLAAVDQNGGGTSYVYNDRGWVTQLTVAGKVHAWTYDNAGNETKYTDPETKEWLKEYDDLNRLKKTTDPRNNIFQFSWWGDGTPKDTTDAKGIITRKTFDWANNEIEITEAYGTANAKTTIERRNNVGFTTEIEDPLGHKIKYVDDGYRRVDKIKDHNDVVKADYDYDAANNVTQFKDGLSKITTPAYDKLERQISITDANNNKTQTIWNANSQQVVAVDGAGKATQSILNVLGQNSFTIDANGAITKRDYDARGLLVGLTDPVGNKTVWVNNALGQVIQEIDPNGNSKFWTYDDSGRPATYTDRLGRFKSFEYFDDGLLKKEIWKTSSGGTTVNTIDLTYNANDQLLTVADNSGTITRTYDDFDRLKTNTDVHSLVLTWSYDTADRLTTLVDSKGGTLTYTFDVTDRLEKRSFSDGTAQLALTYIYNDRNDVTEVRRYTDSAATTLTSKTTYGRDDGGRVTSIHHKDASSATIDHIQYTYDVANRVATETATLGPSRTYTYDPTGQLLGDGTDTFTFDLNGNRTMSGYSTTTGNRITSDGTWNYTHDNEGNINQKTNISTGQVWLYSWDHNNRLTKVERKPSSGGAVDLRVEFKYDVFGNRVEKSLDADGDGSGTATVTKFGYDPDGNAWADLNSSGSLTTRRLYQDAVDTVFARIGASGNEDVYLTDNKGSVRDILDHTGALIDNIDYASFGKVIGETNPSNGDAYQFAGFEVDKDIDLAQNGARWYTFVGLWMSEDPIGFTSGDANPRRYVGNNPTNLIDPSGLSSMPSRHGLITGRAGAGGAARNNPANLIDPFGPSSMPSRRALITGAGGAARSDSMLSDPTFQRLREQNREAVERIDFETELARRQAIWLERGMPAGMDRFVWEHYRRQHESIRAIVDWLPGGASVGYLLEGDIRSAITSGVIDYLTFRILGGLARRAPVGPTLPNTTRGWRVGQPINNLTASGNVPSWSTVRQRFWKNEAHFNSGNYNADNLERMQRGLAPQRVNPRTGQLESMELHHTPPQRNGGLFDVRPVWPDDHALIDPFRRTGN